MIVDEEIESYDRNLAELSYSERDAWGSRVASSLVALYSGLTVELKPSRSSPMSGRRAQVPW